MAQIPRVTPPGGRFVLTLDGTLCGSVIAAEGGDISAPVIREPDGSALLRKRLGPAAPRPIGLSLDLSLMPTVYEWIDQFWQGNVKPRNGTLISLDADLKAQRELAFEEATIRSTTVPGGDAAAKSPGRIAVTVVPQRTTVHAGSGQPVPGVASKAKQQWLASNFRLEIDGLDCKKVSRVETGVVTSSVDAIDVPDLRLTFAEASIATWAAWHHDFVVDGKNDASHEKAGSLTLLAPNGKDQLGTVTFSGLGIYRLSPPAAEDATPAQVPRVVADVYCQQMKLAV